MAWIQARQYQSSHIGSESREIEIYSLLAFI